MVELLINESDCPSTSNVTILTITTNSNKFNINFFSFTVIFSILQVIIFFMYFKSELRLPALNKLC
jgi:hypothetical protein